MLSKLAPAASRMRWNLRKICRVCATMSPTPTMRRSSSVAVVPEMNSRLPTRSAGEKVRRSDHGPAMMASRFVAEPRSLETERR